VALCTPTMAVTPLCSCEVLASDTMCASICAGVPGGQPRTALKTAPRQSRRPGFRAAIDPCIRQMPTGLNNEHRSCSPIPTMQRPIVAANHRLDPGGARANLMEGR